MIKLFSYGAGLALILNVLAVVLSLNYLFSVLLVFGGVSLYLISNAVKLFSVSDWKFSTGFLIFSNICTLIVEVIMMKYDVWGFTNLKCQLIGLYFLSAPIEEYIYWAFCPVIACYSYMLMLKDKFVKSINPFKIASIVKNLKIKKFGNAEYVDAKDGSYSRGAKFPVYIWLQVAIITSIILMKRYFKGCWQALSLTTALFFLIAFPNELYSINSGFWAYNDNKLLGYYLFKIPLEGWMMYFIAPICSSMMIDIVRRKLNI